MEIIHGKEFCIDKPVAVTIGKYEAIHKGHQILIQHTEKYKEKGLYPVVFTFDVHPNVRFDDEAVKLIYNNTEKENILSEHNIEYLIEYPFDDTIINMSPREFFEEILVNKLNAKAVIVGEEFRFGNKRSGDVSTLKSLGEEHNVIIDVVEKQCVEEHKISSSEIREVILKGNMEFATKLLGRPYSITGEVVHGKKLGRTIGMPTINIVPDSLKIIPPRGVYTSKIKIDDKIYGGVSNIGVKPTVDGTGLLGLETYIFDFDADVYGKTVTVELLHFQREEKRFADIEILREQMNKDKEEAYGVLNNE